MKRFTKRKNEVNAWPKTVAPRIYKELDKTYKKGEKMIVAPRIYKSHAMACIGYARHKIKEYIPFCFTKQAYINMYSVIFSSIPYERTWERGESPLIDPPIVQKKIGRPKKCRKRAATELKKRSMRFFINCRVCGGSNHNVRSCPLRPSVAWVARARSTNSQVYV